MKIFGLNTDRGFFRLLKAFYLPHWRIFAISTLFAVLTAAAVSSYSILFQNIVNGLEALNGQAQQAAGDAAAAGAPPDPSVLMWLVAILVGSVILRAISLYTMEILSNTGVQRALVDIQNAQFQALNHGDYARLAGDNSGEWVSRFINDVIALRDAGLRVANNFSRGILTILFCVGAMVYIDWKLTISIFLIYPFAIGPVVSLGNRIRKRSKSAQEQVGDLTALLSEGFRSSRIVRAFGLEAYQDDRADQGFSERSRLYLRVLKDRAAIDPILEIVGGIALALLLGITVWRITLGDTSVGNFMGVIMALFIASPEIRALGTLSALVQEAGAASDRVFAILDAQQSVQNAASPKTLEVAKGQLIFDEVSFGYEADTPVINKISFTIQPGETVAFVGPSGAGKSTIFNLIMRLYDPQDGQVSLDNIPIHTLKLSHLRRAMALVSQDAILFDDSVYANIALGRQNATKDDVVRAAQRANADKFISELSEGYETGVGEMGNSLSGGQRQRVSLARAFVREAPILLLDEATSALDAESEAYIQTALDRFSDGRTTLIIAHRLSTIRRADRILVLEDGKIIEEGDFDSLIAQGGLFANLAKLQFS